MGKGAWGMRWSRVRGVRWQPAAILAQHRPVGEAVRGRRCVPFTDVPAGHVAGSLDRVKPATRTRGAIRIRRADAGDLVRLVELEHRLFVADRISARQMRYLVMTPSASVFAAVDGAHVVGAAVVLFRRGTRVARLYSIGVAPERHGQGVGAALLAAAERVARERADILRLEVRTDNPAAQRLYERRGYRRHVLKRGYYEDGADALAYEKLLRARG